jgi:hypothetical protein
MRENIVSSRSGLRVTFLNTVNYIQVRSQLI